MKRVGVRWCGEELAVTVIGTPTARSRIARHGRGQRGRPQIRDEHYPCDHPGGLALPRDRTRRGAYLAELQRFWLSVTARQRG